MQGDRGEEPGAPADGAPGELVGVCVCVCMCMCVCDLILKND